MKKLLLLLILSISSFSSYAIENESYYSEKFCNEMSGQSEYILKDLSRVDCLTDTHAFEVDWAEGMKVYEAIGQSLYYSRPEFTDDFASPPASIRRNKYRSS